MSEISLLTIEPGKASMLEQNNLNRKIYGFHKKLPLCCLGIKKQAQGMICWSRFTQTFYQNVGEKNDKFFKIKNEWPDYNMLHELESLLISYPQFKNTNKGGKMHAPWLEKKLTKLLELNIFPTPELSKTIRFSLYLLRRLGEGGIMLFDKIEMINHQKLKNNEKRKILYFG